MKPLNSMITTISQGFLDYPESLLDSFLFFAMCNSFVINRSRIMSKNWAVQWLISILHSGTLVFIESS